MSPPLHCMNHNWCVRVDHFDCKFDFISGRIDSNELVFHEWIVCDFHDGSNSVPNSVENVFTGQSVLERGIPDSDVLVEYHASVCAPEGV